MKSMKSTLLLAVAAAGFAAVGTASASVVDVQFLVTGGNTATSFSGSQGAYTGDAVASPTWNVISVANTATSGSATGLVDSSNVATTENISFGMTGGYVSTPNQSLHSYGNAGATNDLFQSYLLTNPSPSTSPGTVTLTGLTDSGSYQLYLYSGSGSYNNAQTNFAITTGTGSPATGSHADVANVGNGNIAFTENTNYVVFNATADATGKLVVSYANPNAAEADINGLQIISAANAVPLPSTLALSLFGVLGVGLLLKQRKASA